MNEMYDINDIYDKNDIGCCLYYLLGETSHWWDVSPE